MTSMNKGTISTADAKDMMLGFYSRPASPAFGLSSRLVLDEVGLKAICSSCMKESSLGVL